MNNEIDLWSLLQFYLKYWFIIFLFVGAGLGVGIVYNTFIQTPLYKSDAKVTFINSKAQTSSRTVRDISNYADLVTSRNVLNKAIETSGEDITFDTLSASTSVKNDKNTDVLDIIVTTPNAHRSAALAGGIVRAFEKEVVSVYKIPQEEVRIIDTTQVIEAPVNVRHNLQLMLAGGAGLILSLIILFFAFDFKNTSSSRQVTNVQAGPTPVRQPRPKTLLDDDFDELPDEFLQTIKPAQRQTPATTEKPARPGSNYRKKSI